MKMAAAEALWDGEAPAPFSVFAYGDVDKGHNKVAIEIPGLLSFLANDDFSSYVPGINDVNKAEQEKFGPGDYRPNIPVAYWGFRWMIGFGMASFAIGLAGLWLTRKKFMLPPAPADRRRTKCRIWCSSRTRRSARGSPSGTGASRSGPWRFPLIANSWGWIFTEMGRQPWVVYGVLRPATRSPPVSRRARSSPR